MSTVTNATAVKDDAMVTVRNLTLNPVAYHVPSLGDLRRELPPRASIKVTAGELRQLNYELGGARLLHDYLCVENKALAREFGVSEDAFENEYNWTVKDIDNALLNETIEVLMDAMEFAPDGVKDSIAQRAVELEIPDINRRKVISDATDYDIDQMIQNKQRIEAEPQEEKKEEKKTTRRRSSSSTTTKRRAQKKETTE